MTPTDIAIGGHSMLDPTLEPTVANQFAVTAKAMEPVADLMQRGERIFLTHGNGPQIGFLQLRSELAKDSLHQVPLDTCGADTQGAIGYQLSQTLDNELRRRGLSKSVAAVVTQVVVDGTDPGFENPSKPIGTTMSSRSLR